MKEPKEPIVGMPQPVLQRVIDYLAERPYKEVAPLVGEIQQASFMVNITAPAEQAGVQKSDTHSEQDAKPGPTTEQ